MSFRVKMNRFSQRPLPDGYTISETIMGNHDEGLLAIRPEPEDLDLLLGADEADMIQITARLHPVMVPPPPVQITYHEDEYAYPAVPLHQGQVSVLSKVQLFFHGIAWQHTPHGRSVAHLGLSLEEPLYEHVFVTQHQDINFHALKNENGENLIYPLWGVGGHFSGNPQEIIQDYATIAGESGSPLVHRVSGSAVASSLGAGGAAIPTITLMDAPMNEPAPPCVPPSLGGVLSYGGVHIIMPMGVDDTGETVQHIYHSCAYESSGEGLLSIFLKKHEEI